MHSKLALVPVEIRNQVAALDTAKRVAIIAAYTDYRDTAGRRRREITTPPDWGNSHRYPHGRRPKRP